MPLLKQILAPTDFSRNSGRAINYACDLATQAKSRLHLLHVVRGELDNGTDTVDRLEHLGVMLDARAELSTSTVKEVIAGQPADAIIQYAQDHEIDLVVMGTHGRTGLAHLTMGSVTECVLRNSPCPVLVLGPHDGETASLNRAAQVLAEAIGDGVEKSLEDGRTWMHVMLVNQLRIPATTAILLVDELENQEWLKFTDGKWTVIEGVDLVDEAESFLPDSTNESPAIDLIKRARKLRATDLHVDPISNKENLVRLRIDGQLKEYCRLHRSVAEHLVNQFKSLAGLDIADPFHAKEGHLRLPQEFSGLDIRLTSIPVAGGQAVALRLFDANQILLPVDHLGLSENAFSTVQQMLRRREGLVLVTGPTGSGKTTTVYSMLHSIGNVQQNIVTIEDPVEYAVPFARQMSVDIRHGVTMTEGLRTILRMDPDVVFIGEIRDMETATIGMRAASSGKYVFSTMHTRNVASTITALRDMELNNRSLSSNLTGIINQRLVRRLCQDCRVEHQLSSHQSEKFQNVGLDVPEKLFNPVGCSACNGTGFHGRIGVFEVVAIGRDIREAILNEKPELELEELWRSNGSVSLEFDALIKAESGLISFDEAVSIRWLA